MAVRSAGKNVVRVEGSNWMSIGTGVVALPKLCWFPSPPCRPPEECARPRGATVGRAHDCAAPVDAAVAVAARIRV